MNIDRLLLESLGLSIESAGIVMEEIEGLRLSLHKMSERMAAQSCVLQITEEERDTYKKWWEQSNPDKQRLDWLELHWAEFDPLDAYIPYPCPQGAFRAALDAVIAGDGSPDLCPECEAGTGTQYDYSRKPLGEVVVCNQCNGTGLRSQTAGLPRCGACKLPVTECQCPEAARIASGYAP